MQREDDTLKRVRQNADSGQECPEKSGVVSFQWKEGLLYRVYKGATGTYKQLAVPKKLRDVVPMAGHMGAKRTRERAWSSFYWPGMAADVRRYCSSCDVCKRMSPGGQVLKISVGSTPVIVKPSRREAVDLGEPVQPASDKGYCYIDKTDQKERLYHINLLKRDVGSEEVPPAPVPVKVSTVAVEMPEEVGYTTSAVPLIPLQASEGPEDVCVGNQSPVRVGNRSPVFAASGPSQDCQWTSYQLGLAAPGVFLQHPRHSRERQRGSRVPEPSARNRCGWLGQLVRFRDFLFDPLWISLIKTV